MGQRDDARSEGAHVSQILSHSPEFDLSMSPPPDLLTQDAKGLPYRFDDDREEVHALEGTRMVPSESNTFFMWTRCGQQDVTARDVYADASKPSCRYCFAIEQSSPTLGQDTTVARLMRADLALARCQARVKHLEQAGRDARSAQDDLQNYRGIVHSLERDLGRTSRR